MKKDICKALMALSFIIIAIVSTYSLGKLKYKANENKVKDINEESLEYSVKYFEDIGFNLPLIIIDTNGKKISGDEKIMSNIQVYDNNNTLNYLTDSPTLSNDINIKIRGNTTRYFPKKQYSLEFVDKNGKDKDISMLRMEKNSDWILNGPFADKSLMRNYIVFKTARNIMEYASDAKFCEVFVIDDGSNTIKKEHYKGVYVALEKIKRGSNRVDVSKSQDNTSETSFIAAKDSSKINDIILSNYGKETYIYDYGLNIQYPKKGLTKDQYEYINQHISEFERVLYSDKFNDPIQGYNKFIDLESFADFYIINEFFKNTDAGILSTYFYKDYDEKIKAGPVWDFNSSMGNHSKLIGPPFDHTGFYMINKSWFDRLMEDIIFSNMVVNRYNILRESYLSDEYLLDLIDRTVLELGDSVKRNFDTWPIYLCNQPTMFKEKWDIIRDYEGNPQKLKEFLNSNKYLFRSTTGRSNTYEEEINLMKNFIVQRGKWMDENIDSLKKWSE